MAKRIENHNTTTIKRVRWGLILFMVSLPIAIFMMGAVYESKNPFLPGDFTWVAENPNLVMIDGMIAQLEPRLDPAIRKYYSFFIEKYTSLYKIDPALMVSVIHIESGWNPLALSKRGAVGLTQIMTKYHADMIEKNGNTIEEASYVEVSIKNSCEYLSGLLKRFNNPSLAIAAYNCGPNQEALIKGKIPQINETIIYTREVMLTYAKLTLNKYKVTT